MPIPAQITDPSDITFRDPPRERPIADMLADQMGLPAIAPVDQWLYEHRRNIGQEPYVDLDERGELRLRTGVETVYPGLAPMIRKGRLAGLSEETIDWAVRQKVQQAIEAGLSSETIEESLYGDATKLGTVRAAKEYAGRVLLPEKIMGYLSWGTKERQYKSTRERLMDEAERARIDEVYANRKVALVNDVAAVTAKAFGGLTFGLGPAVAKRLHGEEMPTAQTIPGTIAGEVAHLAGFLMGPYRAASALFGSAATPTATGLRGVAEILTEGGAKLGTASFVSEIVPALEQSPTLTDATKRVIDSGGSGTIAGMLFPVAGAFESKTVRLAVGLAVADKMRAGTDQWFTIDDVVRGLRDGTISKEELAERSYGYLLDLYFLARVPSMKGQLQMRGRNAMIEDIIRTNPQEAEEFIVALGKAGLVPGTKPEDLEGLNTEDIRRQFGGMEGYQRAFQSLSPTGVQTARDAIAELQAAREAVRAAEGPAAVAGRVPEAAEGAGKQPEVREKIVARPGHVYRYGTRANDFIGMQDRSYSSGLQWYESDGFIVEYSGEPVKGEASTNPEAFRGDMSGRKVTRVYYEPEAYIEEARPKFMAELQKLREQFPDAQFIRLKTVENPETGDFERFVADAAQTPTGVSTPQGQKEAAVTATPSFQKLADAMLVEQSYNRSNALLAALHKGDLKATLRELARLTYDTSANVKRALLAAGGQQGKEAAIRLALIPGAPERAYYQYAKAAGEIYGDLTKADHVLLDRIIESRRTVAISKYRTDFTFTDGLTAEQHQNFLDSIPKDRFEVLNAKADQYFEVMRGQLDQLKAEGLLTQESYDGLISKGDYARRNVIDYIDPVQTYSVGGRKITVRDSGIQSLEAGSESAVETNTMLLMQEVIARTQARIMRNRANKALYDLAKDQPENGVVKIWNPIPEHDKVPHGFEKLTAMVDGQSKEMLMPSDLAREWVTSDPMVSRQWMNIMSWAGGGAILRPMATGYNPFFAMTNIVRDVVHAWTVTTEGGWSPHLPLAVPQIIRDYLAVMPDTFARRGRYVDYVMEGGGMSFLSHQGRVREGANPGTVWSTLETLAGWAGETSELWTRLALRERALRNGMQPHEATWTARNYLDFSQGGSFIKSADALIPYLNASIQGTRGIFRAEKDAPVATTWKFSQLGLLAMGLYLHNRNEKEFWNSVSARDKVTGLNFRVPLPPFIDTDGTKKYYYIHIPLDQGQQVASRIFEGIAAKSLGDPVDADAVVGSVQDLMSISAPGVIPPTIDAMLALAGNYDTWTMDKIWKGEDVQPWREFGPKTSPTAVAAGKALNLSPERLQVAAEQFTTYDNPWSALAGWGLNQIFDKLPEQERQQAHAEAMKQLPGIKRFLRVTDSYNEFRKPNEQIAQDMATDRLTRSMQLDAIADQIAAGKATRSDGMRYIMEQPIEERQRLTQRVQRDIAWSDVPDRKWWLDLADSTPEAAATKYWYRHQQASGDERKALEQTLFQLHSPKIATEKFMRRLTELRSKKQ